MMIDSLIAGPLAASSVHHSLQLLNGAPPAGIVPAAPGALLKLSHLIRLVDQASETLRQIVGRYLRRNQMTRAEFDDVRDSADIRGDDRHPNSEELQERNAGQFCARQHAADIDVANDLDEAVHVDALVDQAKVNDAVSLCYLRRTFAYNVKVDIIAASP